MSSIGGKNQESLENYSFRFHKEVRKEESERSNENLVMDFILIENHSKVDHENISPE